MRWTPMARQDDRRLRRTAESPLFENQSTRFASLPASIAAICKAMVRLQTRVCRKCAAGGVGSAGPGSRIGSDWVQNRGSNLLF